MPNVAAADLDKSGDAPHYNMSDAGFEAWHSENEAVEWELECGATSAIH